LRTGCLGEYIERNQELTTIQLWNQLPADDLGTFPCKPSALRKRVREVIREVK
jgi:hypothetical protein